jgi:cardiolipin synthase
VNSAPFSIRPHVPNALSAARIGVLPVLLWLAWTGQHFVFLCALAASQVTDLLDGYLARRWSVQSELGAKLDILGDTASYLAGLAGLAAFYPHWLEGAAAVCIFVFGALYASRFAAAKLRKGIWVCGISHPVAKVNFYVQSVVIVGLMAGLPMADALIGLGLLIGSLESAVYLHLVTMRARIPRA